MTFQFPPAPGAPPPGYQPQQAQPQQQPPAAPAYPPQYPPQGYPQQPPSYGPPPAAPGWAQPPQQPTFAAPGGDWTSAFHTAQMGNKGGLNFIGVEGRHVVDVLGVKSFPSQRGGGMQFVVETEIVETTSSECSIGEHRAWVINLSKPAGAADAARWSLDLLEGLFGPEFSPVKAMLLKPPAERPAGWQATADQVATLARSITGPDQVAAKTRWGLTTYTKPQVGDQSKSFTDHAWSYMGRSAEGRTAGLRASGPAPVLAPGPAPGPAAPTWVPPGPAPQQLATQGPPPGYPPGAQWPPPGYGGR